MKQTTLEWIVKAEGDFATMERESRARKAPNHDAVCFHAQQCAEKYLKARLEEAGRPFGKTHDLNLLLDATVTVEPLWEVHRPDLAFLTDFGVAVRYPGATASKAAAREARERCRRFRLAVRRVLCPGRERR